MTRLLFATLATLAALAAPATGQHWLSAPLQIPTGNSELRLSGDLDQDGDVDALAFLTGSFAGTVTPWLNDGSGSFDPGTPLSLPASTGSWVALGEVNGDAFLDLIVTATNGSPLGSGVLTFPGVPGALFGAPVFTALPGNVIGIGVGNADGTGASDVAVAHFTASSSLGLTWLLSSGGGNFTLAPTSGTGLFLIDQVQCTDLDADGLDDLVASYDMTLELHRTLGGGSLSLIASLNLSAPVGQYPSSYFDAGDVDGDGDPDLVVGSSGWAGQALTVVRNDGGGSWSPQPSLTFTDSSNWRPMLGDWDQDGRLDVVALTFQPQTLFFQNQGAGVFTRVRTVWSHEQGWITHASLRDFDDDGFLDVHMPREILFGNGSFDDPNGGADRATLMADWEGDGDQDLLTTSGEVILNDGRGVFETVALSQPAPPAGTFFVPDMIVGDFDQDGIVEYLATVMDEVPFPFPPVFREMRRLVPNPAGQLIDMGLASPGVQLLAGINRDIDADGDLDLLNRAGLWRNTAGFFSGPVATWSSWQPVDAADVDGDGDLDLLATGPTGSQSVALLRQSSGGTFAVEILIASGSSTTLYNLPLLADLDNDGDLDVAVDVEPNGTSITILENLGGSYSQVFHTHPPHNLGSSRLLATDIDADGRTDLLIVGSSTLVYRRDGPGWSYDPPRNFRARLGGPARVTDIDNDGDEDLLIGEIVRSRSNFGADTGGSRQYGVGSPGSGDHVPVLGAGGAFRADNSGRITVRRSLGGSTGLLFVALTEADIPNVRPQVNLYIGGLLLVLDISLLGTPGLPAAGSYDLVVDRYVPALAGRTLYHQALVVDPGAALGYAVTNGLEIRYGL